MKFTKILTAENADECIVYSAKTLKKYILKVSGEELGISTEPDGKASFSVGKTAVVTDDEYKTATSDVEGDGFSLSVLRGNVLIAAKTSRGVMYGVYDYIEKFLGVRFLTADAEYIPENGSIVVPDKNYFSNPDFSMRTYLFGDTFQDTADMDHIARTRTVDLFTEVDKTHGGKTTVYGRNVNHNFHFYVPFEKYGNDHPEFYRFIYVNAEILPTIDITNGITDDGKLDESMDVSVAKIVIDEMKKDIEKYPDVEVFCFTQEDGPYYFDDEHNHALEAKYKRSGILIRFCNVLVRELNKYLAEKGSRRIKIMTFAYDYAKEAPVKTENGNLVPLDETVVADENLIIQLALFRNGYYDYFSDKQEPHIRKSMSEWKIVADNFWFWAYDSDFHRYLFFYDSFRNIAKDVRGFKDYGITYLCVQGSHDSTHIWQNKIRAYAYRKLMWNSKLDDNRLIDEFIDLYYGEGANAVRTIISLFHKQFEKLEEDGKTVFCGSFGSCEKPEANPPELLYEAIKAVEKGEQKISSTSLPEKTKAEFIRRLEEVRLTPLMLLCDNYYFYYPSAPREEYEAARKDFFDCAERANLDKVAERWTTDMYRLEPGTSERTDL